MNNTFRLSAIALALAISGAAHAATVLTVASFPSLDEDIKTAIPLYKKVKPDVEIKLVSLAGNDHHNAMTTALATGANQPDLMAIEFGFIGKFAESGGLEDLNKPPYNAQQFKSKFFKFTFAQATGSDGHLAALPVDIGPGTLYYRKDLFDKAGISEADLTKSWDSYVESGKKLKAATGAYLISSANAVKDIYIRTGLKDGQGIYFDKDGKTLVESERFVKGFELAKTIRTAGLDGKIGAWSNEWSEGFKQNKLATEMMGAWLAGHLGAWIAPNTKGLWRSAQLPGNSYAAYGGSFYGIPSKAPNKAEAWELLKFLTMNKEQQIAAFEKLDAFPSLIEASTTPFMDEPIPFLGGQKARQLWKTAAEKIPATDVDKYDPVAAEIVSAELDKVLEQNKDIKQALADAKAQIERRVRRK